MIWEGLILFGLLALVGAGLGLIAGLVIRGPKGVKREVRSGGDDAF